MPTQKKTTQEVLDEEYQALGYLLGILEGELKAAENDKTFCPAAEIDDIEYPIEVTEVKVGQLGILKPIGADIGSFVSVRPASEDKTYLGVMIGDLPVYGLASYRPSTKTLTFAGKHNPAIFIPDLGRTVFGTGSYWGKIKDENHLRQITDNDIESLWYVQALKQLSKDEEDEEKETGEIKPGEATDADPE